MSFLHAIHTKSVSTKNEKFSRFYNKESIMISDAFLYRYVFNLFEFHVFITVSLLFFLFSRFPFHIHSHEKYIKVDSARRKFIDWLVLQSFP